MNLTSAPGPRSAAGFMWVAGAPSLVLFLDPGNFALQLPPFPDGPRFLAKFCRELARESAKLADALEGPEFQVREPQWPGDGGRHALSGEVG